MSHNLDIHASRKFFGIGWAKTGTTTLGTCFKLLGYNHQGQDLELARALEAEGPRSALQRAVQKDTFEDWPWLILYKELDQAFPGSGFILTTRDPARWVKSYTNALARKKQHSAADNHLRRYLYGLPFPNVTEDQLISRFEKHNRDVAKYFADRKQDLLIVDWERGSGWKELCEFLSRPVPDLPFPHSNKGSYGKDASRPWYANALRRYRSR